MLIGFRGERLQLTLNALCLAGVRARLGRGDVSAAGERLDLSCQVAQRTQLGKLPDHGVACCNDRRRVGSAQIGMDRWCWQGDPTAASCSQSVFLCPAQRAEGVVAGFLSAADSGKVGSQQLGC